MSTDSTEPPERAGRAWPRWLRIVGLPVAGAVLLGLGGGAAFYYVVEQRRPAHHVPSAAKARRVSSSHVLVELQGDDQRSAAFALVARTSGGPKILNVPAAAVVEVPGTGPRTVALAMRQSGPEGAAVAVANALRVTVPAALMGTPSAVAATVDAAGGADVAVPKDLHTWVNGFRQTVFSAGATHMTGAEFVRYQTGSFSGENDQERDARQLAGWRALLAAVARQSTSLSSWTSDIDVRVVAGLLSSAARPAGLLTVPVTGIELAGEHIVRIDEGRLPPLREALHGLSNGAESVENRRVRLIVGASGPIGPEIGRILVNAGYVVAFSGKATTPADTTQIDVSPTVPRADAEADALVRLLGAGTARVFADTAMEADIMLVIGMDWAEANGFPQH